MRKEVVATAVLCTGGLALAALWPPPVERAPRKQAGTVSEQRARLEGRHQSRKIRALMHEAAERKRIRPSIHRASPAELALRNRVAGEEAAKVRAREELK